MSASDPIRTLMANLSSSISKFTRCPWRNDLKIESLMAVFESGYIALSGVSTMIEPNLVFGSKETITPCIESS